ncbi:MAG: BLUF domain-containing protein [Marinobacter sp.]
MPNVRAIYTSKMSYHVGPMQIQNILDVARLNNRHNDLTGLLCFGARQFLQCLEGPREAVNYVYASIIRDSRHSSIVLLSYMEVENREFSDWKMGYVPESSMTSQVLSGTMGDGFFAPLKLNSHSALGFLQDVKKCLPVL